MASRSLARPLLSASRRSAAVPAPAPRAGVATKAAAATTTPWSGAAAAIPVAKPAAKPYVKVPPKTPVAKKAASTTAANKPTTQGEGEEEADGGSSLRAPVPRKTPTDLPKSQAYASPPPDAMEPDASEPVEAPGYDIAPPQEPFDVDAAQQLVAPAPAPAPAPGEVDWARSYHGLASRPFSREKAAILTQTIDPRDIEVKSDGIIYLPEIKYRRILNAAFGPGGWGMVPRGDVVVGERVVTREYALIVEGRFIAQAQGENQYFSLEALPAAVEGCKSNALMRCCKDVGIASELWDPNFIRSFRQKHAEQVWVEHIATKKKRQIWNKVGLEIVYPYKSTK